MIPIKKPSITQVYGNKDPDYVKGYHTGIDIKASGVDKGIYSANAGIVLRARFSPGSKGSDPNGWGNYIIIRQDDGYDVIYAHLAQLAVVQGQKIAAGEKIGLQGSTGNSTGPHLHFEIRKPSWENRNEVDPTAYLGINNQTGEVRAIPHDPYADDRDWAISKGITDGLEPDRQATRKEVWAMLRRLVS